MSAIDMLIQGRSKDLGGFSVTRVLPVAQRRRVGPFVFFDEMGPAKFKAGQGIDVRPHPNIGLSTVTYLFEGEIHHADCLGYEKPIRPGAVNLMTAGHGIVHSERTDPEQLKTARPMHGIQVWLALPHDQEEMDPAFEHTPAEQLPEWDVGGATLRLILGGAYGYTSPVRTYVETIYIHGECPAGSRFELPDGVEELAVYPVSGEIEIDGELIPTGQMAVLPRNSSGMLQALSDARVMILGGQDVGERFMEWNFVSSSKERIEKAKADWRASIENRFENSVFRLPPSEHEWIPLPGDPEPGQPPECCEEHPTS